MFEKLTEESWRTLCFGNGWFSPPIIAKFIAKFPGLLGDSVPSRSDKSESSETDSAKGNLPIANSIKEIPVDQTSDLTVYCAPWIRSGYKKARCELSHDHKNDRTNTHVRRSPHESIGNRID